jgi:hypothetical protein
MTMADFCKVRGTALFKAAQATTAATIRKAANRVRSLCRLP